MPNHKHHASLVLAVAAGFLLLANHAQAQEPANAQAAKQANTSAQTWTNPAVPDYGRMHPYKDVALIPSASKVHKIVFNVTGKGLMDDVNAPLWHVARAVNVYAGAGVPKENRVFAVVVHGGATDAIMSDETYQARHGKPNPNTKILQELTDAGVKLYVCGQALADNGLGSNMINKNVTVSLSALAAVPELEAQGYALFPM